MGEDEPQPREWKWPPMKNAVNGVEVSFHSISSVENLNYAIQATQTEQSRRRVGRLAFLLFSTTRVVSLLSYSRNPLDQGRSWP